MASNGGTLHGGPQMTNGHYNCSHCGTYFDSSTSLQVHMHYHHQQTTGQDVTQQQASRWPGVVTNISASSNPTTPTEDNNNQPSVKNHIKSSSPLVQAAADSQSDNNQESQNNNNNNQVTPVSESSSLVFNTNSASNNSNSASPLSYQQQQQQEMHPYPHYIGYEQYYHPHNIDYGAPLPAPPLPQHHQLSQHTPSQAIGTIQPQEYKTVPSTRFHPYSSSQQSLITHLNKNGLSPKVVSSSAGGSPLEGQGYNDQDIPPGQPTPSPSPKHCDKCGMVCDTPGQMAEHQARAHPETRSEDGTTVDQAQNNYPSFTNSYIKEEPSSDILDLDSQKMVYPPQQHPGIPPMHPSAGGLHPLQSMQRHPMVWGHEMPHHPGFMPPHQPGYKTADYPPTPPQQTPTAHIKSEYHLGSTATQLSSNLSKGFADNTPGNGVVPSGIENSLPTSPQDFPSTTTPQDNGTAFRTFETPTSSLSAVGQKSTAWKSNEARRPKTYNCTACNKWFTSSGHLKRHYNTTLHKNAVKSSGQPDPALAPISHHHHPNRDPNYTGKSRRSSHQSSAQSQLQHQQQQLDQRSPEYTPNQFALPSLNQGFQQYGGAHPHASNINGSLSQQGNEVADRIIQASTESGLLNFSENTQQIQKIQVLDQQVLQLPRHHSIIITNSSLGQENTMDLYNIQPINHLTINTNIQSYQVTQSEAQNYHHIIGNDRSQESNNMADNSEGNNQDHHEEYAYYSQETQYDEMPEQQKPMAAYTRMSNVSSSLYQGDMPPPFSPDIPQTTTDQMYTLTSNSMNGMAQIDRSMTPLQATIAPSTSPAPYSPSITSTNNCHNQLPIQNTQISATDSHMIEKRNNTSNTNKFTQNVAQISDSKRGEYKCIQCDKVFNKICYLTQHNKTFHSGEKPYKCSRCGKRFPCEESSEEHFAKHAGDKPFKCEICPKQFNHKTDLRRHMCIHSGSKPYCCAQCGKGFIRKDHMIKHTETHKKREAMLANRKASKTNKQIKKVQMYDTNTSGSDISTISSTESCKNEQIQLMI
uniref:CSON008662 protein n=1 Tax=Culicoides sonorensis TaxID=179676 RepID=A0A336LCT8_CULSO